MTKEPTEDNDENFDSNIQFENENSTISNKMNKVDELENTNSPDQKHSSAGVDSTNSNKNKEKVVKNEIKVSVTDASQVTNRHVVHIPIPLRYFQFTSTPGLIQPALALTSLTAQQGGMMGHGNMNRIMQLQPPGANTTNGFSQYILGLSNMQVISAVQPIVRMWQPTALPIAMNYIEPHQSIIHPQPNGNIIIPQPKHQGQPAFQVHEQALQTLQQSQHNVSSASNEGTMETTKQQSSEEQSYKQQSAFQVYDHGMMDVVKVNSIKQLRSARANINNVSTVSSSDTLRNTTMYRKSAACPYPNFRVSDRSRNKSSKQHICYMPGCGKVYVGLSSLLAHLRRHTGEHPYVCNWESCGKRFSRLHLLYRHERNYHTDEGGHQCPECNKTFMRADHLIRHSKTHKMKRTKVSNVI